MTRCGSSRSTATRASSAAGRMCARPPRSGRSRSSRRAPSAPGVRRIEAVTSGEAYALLHARAREVDELRAELERARKEGPRREEKVEVRVEPSSEEEIGGVNVYVGRASGVDGEALLAESDRIKQERAPAAVVLGSNEDGRVHLVANFDRSLEGRLDAVAVIKRSCGRGRRRRRRATDDGARGRQEPREAGRRAREGGGGAAPGARVKVLALDFGRARTGVAVSDPSGTIARPLEIVERAGSEAGLARLAELDPRGGGRARGRRAAADPARRARRAGPRDRGVRRGAPRRRRRPGRELTTSASRPRLAQTVAGQTPLRPDDARAAAHLLSSYLEWSSAAKE